MILSTNDSSTNENTAHIYQNVAKLKPFCYCCSIGNIEQQHNNTGLKYFFLSNIFCLLRSQVIFSAFISFMLSNIFQEGGVRIIFNIVHIILHLRQIVLFLIWFLSWLTSSYKMYHVSNCPLTIFYYQILDSSLCLNDKKRAAPTSLQIRDHVWILHLGHFLPVFMWICTLVSDGLN